MSDTPVLQRVCNLCGVELSDSCSANTCSECVSSVGSVVIVPAPTVARAPAKGVQAGSPHHNTVQASGPHHNDVQPLDKTVQTGNAQKLAPNPFVARTGIFGDYEILSEIAAGGMGVVYLARQISLNRRVAVKMILTPFARPEQIRRFQAEAEHAATLEHPNIVPIYDSGSINGVPYFTMKLIQGRGLNAELRRLVLEPRKGVALMATIARAVHYAHQRGILHRDLKPANILIDEQGVPYVTDFGIAKRVGTSDGMTREGAIIGTPYYMSPEQANGISATLTTAADVYGLGAIFYEILTLRSPFHNATPHEILQKVIEEDPIAPRAHRANVDRDLETICLKCLEKNPVRRYASAEAFACDLERWLRHEPIAARPHSLPERAFKWARRRPAVACSAALAVVLAALVAGFSWHSQDLVKRAEAAKIEERRLACAVAVDQGVTALESAQKALAKNRGPESENALIEAEDRFRTALVNVPDNGAAIKGLRDTALLNFDASLRAKNYRQAREKLLLAHSAQLSENEFNAKSAQLSMQESQRGDVIRARVKELMDDAASLTRKRTHENAVYELITMKDPLTVELVSKYISHERHECRALACAALAWIGDTSVVPLLIPYIQPRTPTGAPNENRVQEAAINAICMLAADDDDNAYSVVERRIYTEPDNKSSLLYHGVKCRFVEFSQRQARHAVGAPDESPEKLLLRAERLADAEQYLEALALFDRLVAQFPENNRYLNQRGLARLHMKYGAGALEDFNLMVERLPNRIDGYVNRSQAKSLLKDKPGALKDLDRAVEIAPNDSELLATRGVSRIENGDVKGGIADYDRALKINPNELFALTNRGHARARLNDMPGALTDYDRALALSPNFRPALYGRACTRMILHDIDGSIADFDKTLALDPSDTNCYYNRATLRIWKNDWKEAMRDLDHYIGLNPTSSVAYFQRGICHASLKDFDASAQDYRKAIELDPARADAMVNLGNYHMNKGETKEAMELYNRSIAIRANRYEAWSCRADLHFKLGRKEEAVNDMRKAIELIPADAEKGVREIQTKKLSDFEAALKK